ncbi:hypothetical protein E2C01_081440 [Portunus trituberculatus]|uniref:Uncharacterized protein n=1 Tax=Portunus trituberculatus TaxID=210409 RepID=A0A5B7IY71_PORTR|nr:hypothetical protein [Portunus trituberculatus]
MIAPGRECAASGGMEGGLGSGRGREACLAGTGELGRGLVNGYGGEVDKGIIAGGHKAAARVWGHYNLISEA